MKMARENSCRYFFKSLSKFLVMCGITQVFTDETFNKG